MFEQQPMEKFDQCQHTKQPKHEQLDEKTTHQGSEAAEEKKAKVMTSILVRIGCIRALRNWYLVQKHMVVPWADIYMLYPKQPNKPSTVYNFCFRRTAKIHTHLSTRKKTIKLATKKIKRINTKLNWTEQPKVNESVDSLSHICAQKLVHDTLLANIVIHTLQFHVISMRLIWKKTTTSTAVILPKGMKWSRGHIVVHRKYDEQNLQRIASKPLEQLRSIYIRVGCMYQIYCSISYRFTNFTRML